MYMQLWICTKQADHDHILIMDKMSLQLVKNMHENKTNGKKTTPSTIEVDPQIWVFLEAMAAPAKSPRM